MLRVLRSMPHFEHVTAKQSKLILNKLLQSKVIENAERPGKVKKFLPKYLYRFCNIKFNDQPEIKNLLKTVVRIGTMIDVIDGTNDSQTSCQTMNKMMS
ncbi:uncharacterized protein LOC120328545 isoform X2 [Styela clava]